ncbi:LemA family protein [Vagococcus acidifermentans]|uniref:LemA family protein n=1 Tax=Vagococcus acidifermentans TaxID=564710 RepID=A0A430B313_9ENTE|nr:LemA family protein [Vagococcus acidifermentans]RSU14699.1 LemA family protein [Vagococcus acidifermentans]
MKKKTIVLSSIGVVIALIAVFFITTYNNLVSLDNDVSAKWSQVDNVMQRRYDLIPNLVNSVKGSMKQEQTVFNNITEARKAYANATDETSKIAADNQIGESVGTLVNIIHEQYPELGSNENVKTLMTQLEGTENRISVERKRYIDTVNEYNKSIVRFPRNVVANMFGFEKKDNFEAESGAETVPTVDFDTEGSN